MSCLNGDPFYEIQDFQFKKLIGKGRLSTVWLVYKQNEDKYYAAKVLNKKNCSNDVVKFFYNEISIFSSLNHNNIVRYYGNRETSSSYVLIMEYCSGNSLLSCLKRHIQMYKKPFTEVIIQQIMNQIVKGLKYLHENNIIHRDLKSENIFVKFYNLENYNKVNLDKTHIKIGDFGFSIRNEKFSSIAGTPVYMDPRILKKYNERTNKKNSEIFDKSCDIWSLGVICFEMITGRRVFNGEDISELYQNVEKGDYELPISLSEEIVSFINGMLQYDPKKRLTIEQLSHHRFLTKNIKDFKQLHLSLVESKVDNGQLKINIIKNDSIWGIFNEDNFLRSISSFFFNEFPKEHKQNIIPNFPLQSGVKGHLHHNINKNEIRINQEINNIKDKIINNNNQVRNSHNSNNYGVIRQSNKYQNNKNIYIDNNNQIRNSNIHENINRQKNNKNNMIINNNNLMVNLNNTNNNNYMNINNQSNNQNIINNNSKIHNKKFISGITNVSGYSNSNIEDTTSPGNSLFSKQPIHSIHPKAAFYNPNNNMNSYATFNNQSNNINYKNIYSNNINHYYTYNH